MNRIEPGKQVASRPRVFAHDVLRLLRLLYYCGRALADCHCLQQRCSPSVLSCLRDLPCFVVCLLVATVIAVVDVDHGATAECFMRFMRFMCVRVLLLLLLFDC